MILFYPNQDQRFQSSGLRFRMIAVGFSIFLGRLCGPTRIMGMAMLLPIAAAAGSPNSTPPEIAARLPEVRDAVFNVHSLVTQPVVGAAWIATMRIGVSEDGTRSDGQDPRMVWSAALATARSAFAYDVSNEIEASVALVREYADEELKSALSNTEISQLFSYFRASEGRQYLNFVNEIDGIADYAGYRVLLQVALGRPIGEETSDLATTTNVEHRRAVINLSRSAGIVRLADKLLASSDRVQGYGPVPWDAVVTLITESHQSGTDPLLIQYQSVLDRRAESIDKIYAVTQLDPYRRAQMATQHAAKRWLMSQERARLISAISRSMDRHLSCWQALWRDNKEVQCVTFAPH